MPFPEERERRYGPEVRMDNVPGLGVAVSQEYGGEPKAPVLWRGKVTLFFIGEELMDIEATMLKSKEEGGKPYISWPQRQYETSGGETKYMNVVWVHMRALGAATAEAIIRFKKEGWAEAQPKSDSEEGDDRPW